MAKYHAEEGVNYERNFLIAYANVRNAEGRCVNLILESMELDGVEFDGDIFCEVIRDKQHKQYKVSCWLDEGNEEDGSGPTL